MVYSHLDEQPLERPFADVLALFHLESEESDSKFNFSKLGMLSCAFKEKIRQDIVLLKIGKDPRPSAQSCSWPALNSSSTC